MFQSLSVPGAGVTWLSPARSRSQRLNPPMASAITVQSSAGLVSPSAASTPWLPRRRHRVSDASAVRVRTGPWSGPACVRLPPACQVPCLSCPRRGRRPLRPRRRVRLQIMTVLRRVALSSNVHSCDPKLRTINRESTFLSSYTELSSSTVCMVRQIRVYIHIYDICAMCL